MARPIVLAGTLDTKSEELGFVRRELENAGLPVILIDCGVLGTPSIPANISREAIAGAGGGDLASLRAAKDRAAAMATMTRGLEREISRLVKEERIGGFMGVGGGTNAAFAAAAFRLIPYGIPKMLVSTVACGNTRPFIGIRDVVLVHSVVDILGLNDFVVSILSRSAKALAAMVHAAPSAHPDGKRTHCVGLTSYGSTTETSNRCYEGIVAAGLECLAFHARGVGGEAMESLIREGRIQSVLDLTTTEIADEIVGGICSAGPDRLSAAGNAGIPQVVLPGGIDIVNFGPSGSVPPKFSGRTFAAHTSLATLMRTTADENREIARFTAEKLNAAKGPVHVILPARGYSAYDREGQPFFDPQADRAYEEALQAALAPRIEVHRIDAHINDKAVSDLACTLLLDCVSRAEPVTND